MTLWCPGCPTRGHTAPTARITTCRTCGVNEAFSCSTAWKCRALPQMTGLCSAGLKGLMKRPSLAWLADPARSPHGTTDLVMRS